MTKSAAIMVFNEKYSELKEGEKKDFSRIANKLLQVTFITRRKIGDANDYRTLLGYKDLFEAFFILIDFSFNIHRHDEVVFIKNEGPYNRLSLRKDESILILVLRILFQRKYSLVTLDENVEVYLSDIHNELSVVGFFDSKRITKERLKDTLRMLRNYNLIDYLDPNLNDDARIKIYPTILYVTDFENIKNVIDLLQQYQQGGNLDENPEEN